MGSTSERDSGDDAIEKVRGHRLFTDRVVLNRLATEFGRPARELLGVLDDHILSDVPEADILTISQAIFQHWRKTS